MTMVSSGEKCSVPTRMHLVFKTHLDIGFTDFAANVIDQYLDCHIPQAIRTARQMRESGSADRFIWTTGSWLIHEALEKGTSSLKRELEKAILDGDVVWHGLPFTTHSELMDPGLFRFGLGLAQELDRRFGKKTIAAKMTDVPGHTRAIVPLLAEAGIRFLHIGVNAASHPPDVPDCFRWRHDDGSEIIVAYGKSGYGSPLQIDGIPDVLNFGHTGDNCGPQTSREVAAQFARLRSESPDMLISGSTLDAFTEALCLADPKLPVVTAEIGDTWIHGSGSDPGKVRIFLEHCRNGLYSKNLLLVAEHTWGLDTKQTFHQGKKKRFRAVPVQPNGIFRKQRKRGKYRRWEESWKEQRAYIGATATKLPPVSPDSGKVLPNSAWFRYFRPVLIYEIFGSCDYDRFIGRYNPNLEQTREWAIPDFSKPGLEAFLKYGRRWEAEAGPVHDFGSFHRAEYRFPPITSVRYGCPRSFHLVATENQLVVEWRDKPASRIPEAIWIGFLPEDFKAESLWMVKTGQVISPFDVVRHGARLLHAVSEIGGDRFSLRPLDSPLFSPGPPALLDFQNRPPNPENGLFFCLYNNVWGTNFPMWYDEDASFRFLQRERA